MIKISGREALFAGFRLIRREPVAFLVWCVVCFALGVAPQLLALSSMMEALVAMSTAGGDAFGPEMMAAQQKMMRFAPLTYLSSFALMLLIPTAVFRAVLRPDERAFMFMKVGPGEWWFLIVAVAYFIAYFVGFIVFMIPWMLMVGLGALLTQLGAIGALLTVLLMLIGMPALFGGLIWWLLRFSMAPVMAFAERTFRFTESWRFTRGHAWKMFLVALGGFVLTAIAYVVVLGGIVLGAGLNLATIAADVAQDPGGLVAAIGLPWLVVGVLATSVLTGGYYVIWAASWADIYRQLRPSTMAETFD